MRELQQIIRWVAENPLAIMGAGHACSNGRIERKPGALASWLIRMVELSVF